MIGNARWAGAQSNRIKFNRLHNWRFVNRNPNIGTAARTHRHQFQFFPSLSIRFPFSLLFPNSKKSDTIKMKTSENNLINNSYRLRRGVKRGWINCSRMYWNTVCSEHLVACFLAYLCYSCQFIQGKTEAMEYTTIGTANWIAKRWKWFSN